MIHCYDLEVKHGATLISIPGLLAADCGGVYSGDDGNWTDADTSIENLASCRTDCSNPDASFPTGFDVVIGEGVAANYNSVLGWVGSLNDVEPLNGYWLKMDLIDNQGNSTSPCTIEVCVVPENPLDSGELYMSWDNFGIGGQFFTSPDQWCEIFGECPDMSGCPDGEECLPSDYINPDDCPDCPVYGCTDPNACFWSYNENATIDDGSCLYSVSPCASGTHMGDIGPCGCDGSTCLTELDCGGNCGAPASGTLINDCTGCTNDINNPDSQCMDSIGCTTLAAWEAYRDNYMDNQECRPEYACFQVEQTDGTFIDFQCAQGRCLDDCGVCNGNNDCADCADVVNGEHVFDGYPLCEYEDLNHAECVDNQLTSGGCCLQTNKVMYWLDSDGDGQGEGQGYYLCPNNPNLGPNAYHTYVPNNLDECVGGIIDICGNCTSDSDYPTDGVNACGGCTDNTTPACNYEEEAIWDDGSCYYTYDNNSLYCNCESDSQPDAGFDCDGNCLLPTDDGCDCGVLQDCAGTCDGQMTSCSDVQACNFGVCATCVYPFDLYGKDYVDCFGRCINDLDDDGVCDEDEVTGCTDIDACNYNSSATDDDGSCEYPEQYEDCDGNCLNNVDGDELCDEVDGGCTYEDACNYDSGAQFDDGTCTFAEYPFDCNGDCIATGPTLDENGEDCQGTCDGTAVVDECGVCGGSGIFESCGCVDTSAGLNEDGCCDEIENYGCGCGNPAPVNCADDPLSNGNICGTTSTCYPTIDCSAPTGCDEECGSTLEFDECGVCGGDNSTCLDDCGVPNGDNSTCLDDCGEVNGDNSSCSGCTYPGADNYDENATIDNGTCTFTLRPEADEVQVQGEFRPISIDGSIPHKNYFDFYYPYETSISAKNIYDYIWLINPDEHCGDVEWDDCDMSEVPSLGSVGSILNGDSIQTLSFDGYSKGMLYLNNDWQFNINDPNETDFGNAVTEGYDTDVCGDDEGTCITKGFIARLRFLQKDAFSDCTPDSCTGQCPSQATGNGSYTCDCGVREEMIRCGSPFGWLKFKETE